MSDPWQHDFVEANGIRFHVVTAGSGPLVLLLHGFPQFWYAWRHQIPALAEHYRVVAPDLRGYGESDKPKRVADYRIEVLAEDVRGLVQALGAEKAHVVGHDWGGGVAWATALLQPRVVDTLGVLNCPHPVPFAKALRSSPRQLARSWYIFLFQLPWIPELGVRHRIVDGAFRPWAIRPDTFSDEDLEAFRRNVKRPGAARAMVNYYRAAFRDPGMAGRLAGQKIDSPTLLVWGEQDRALGKELTYDMEDLFSGPFRIEYVAECSHWVNEERPELVNRLLLDHFARGPKAT